MKPIWILKDGGKVVLYDMATTHIQNALRMRERSHKTRNGMRTYNTTWIAWFQEELQAREGEVPGNPGNLTIEQLKAARELRRVLLGLPPVIPVEPVLVKYDKPKKSLFEYD